MNIHSVYIRCRLFPHRMRDWGRLLNKRFCLIFRNCYGIKGSKNQRSAQFIESFHSETNVPCMYQPLSTSVHWNVFVVLAINADLLTRLLKSRISLPRFDGRQGH
jgi:hypothetical protein